MSAMTTTQAPLRDDHDPETAPATAASGVKSSLRTLEILELLSTSSERQTIAEMTRRLGIPKSSLHGILRTMVQRGWLETDAAGTRYGIGIRALLIGNAYVDGDDLVAISKGALDHVAETTGETVHLGRLDGADIVYLAKRESRHALRLYSAVGRRLPAHATALGKALLAQLPPEEVDRTLTWPLTALTPLTITDHDELHADLDRVRADGFATDDGENAPDIACFAVPLRARAHSLNAISCSVPKTRITEESAAAIVDALRDAARIIDRLAPSA